MSFPSVREPSRLPPPPESNEKRKRRFGRNQPSKGLGAFDPEDLKRYGTEYSAASAEYQNWLDCSQGYRVGIPGFFSRYATGIETNWAAYAASDAATLPDCSFEFFAEKIDRVFFDPPPVDIPSDLFLLVRDIDNAYVDLFVRDEWAFDLIRYDLAKQGIGAKPFTPLKPTGAR